MWSFSMARVPVEGIVEDASTLNSVIKTLPTVTAHAAHGGAAHAAPVKQ